MAISQKQADRIEQKLDTVIRFFNIGEKPRETVQQIDEWLDKKLRKDEP